MKILYLIPLLFLINCHGFESESQQLKSHVHYFASDQLEGRYPTLKGDTLSQEYIQNFFNKNGLESLNSKSSYLQNFPFLSKIKASESNKISIELPDSIYQLKHSKDFVVYTQSGSAEVSGDIVFIGYGIDEPDNNYDDYRKVDLKEKVAICYIVPPKTIAKDLKKMAFKLNHKEKTNLLTSLGCKAVIFVLPKSYNKHDSIIPLKKKNRFRQRSTQEHIPMIQLSYTAFEKLMRKININIDKINKNLLNSHSSLAFDLPDVRIHLDIQVKYDYKNTANIIGFLKGKDTTQSIIIGAHYDHIGISNRYSDLDSICNGADDNASGVAVLLELSEFCSKNSPFGCNLCFIAFGAEESGIIGSRYLIKNLPKNIGNIKCMMNLDMVGRMQDDTLYVNHFNSADEWHEYFSVIQSFNFNFVYDKINAGSDSDSFVREGIPSIWFTTGFHADYHKPSDEYEKLNYVGMEKILLFSQDLINQVSQSSNKLTFVPK